LAAVTNATKAPRSAFSSVVADEEEDESRFAGLLQVDVV
jgi:hypothetical protein